MPDIVIVKDGETPPTQPTTPASAPSSTDLIPALELGKVIQKVESLETAQAETQSTAQRAAADAQAALERPATIIETPAKQPETESEAALVPVVLEPETETQPPAKARTLFARLFLG